MTETCKAVALKPDDQAKERPSCHRVVILPDAAATSTGQLDGRKLHGCPVPEDSTGSQ